MINVNKEKNNKKIWQKQNTFNENSKKKVSDPEKTTDVNWLKYKLRFWMCSKSFLQTVFCTVFCKLCTFFWYLFKLQQKLSYPPIFQTNTFFKIWDWHLHSTNLKLVWLETSFQQEFITKNLYWFLKIYIFVQKIIIFDQSNFNHCKKSFWRNS